METETLDKLYLEWSQFTKARNSRELAMADALNSAMRAINYPDMKDERRKETTAKIQKALEYMRVKP